MRPEQKRVKQLLTEAITLLCRNSLQFKEEVTVEGLLGITLDKSDIFLVSIHETIQSSLREGAAEVRAEKRSVDNGQDGHTPKKRRRRRGSREGSSSPPPSPSEIFDSDSNTDAPPKESSDRVNIKSEKTGDDADSSQDGRKFNPAHDSTSDTPSDIKPVFKDFPFKALATSTPGGSGDTGEVKVKQEVEEEEEECFLVDSDSRDASDTSHQSLPADGSSMGAQSWASAGGDQSGFNLSELDMISAANFQQQFGNLGMIAGANNLGNMTWDGGSQLPGQGQPSTSGVQDGSQRTGAFPCPQCRYAASRKANLQRHFRTVHLQIKDYRCPECGKRFAQKQHYESHLSMKHTIYTIETNPDEPDPTELDPTEKPETKT